MNKSLHRSSIQKYRCEKKTALPILECQFWNGGSIQSFLIGGDGGIRTPDRVIMIHLLCRLSYIALGRKG